MVPYENRTKGMTSSPGHTCLSNRWGHPSPAPSPSAPRSLRHTPGQRSPPSSGPRTGRWGRPPVLGALAVLVLLFEALPPLRASVPPALQAQPGPSAWGSLALPVAPLLAPGAHVTYASSGRGPTGSSCASFTGIHSQLPAGGKSLLCAHLGRCSLHAPPLPSEVRQMRTLRLAERPRPRLLIYEMREQHLPLQPLLPRP